MPKLSRILLTTLFAITPLMAMEREGDHRNSDQSMGWNNFPREVQALIIGQLDVREVAIVSMVSKELYTLAHDDIVWKQLVNRDFPGFHGGQEDGRSWKEVYKIIKQLNDDLKQYWVMHPEADEFLVTQSDSSLLFTLIAVIPPTIKTITIPENNIVSLPPTIEKLTPITHLNLTNNEIQILPHGISNLTDLECLNLRNNQLRALPEGLSNLKKLEMLDLPNNPLDPVSVTKYLETAPTGLVVIVSRSLYDEIETSEKWSEIISRCDILY